MKKSTWQELEGMRRCEHLISVAMTGEKPTANKFLTFNLTLLKCYVYYIFSRCLGASLL